LARNAKIKKLSGFIMNKIDLKGKGGCSAFSIILFVKNYEVDMYILG